ncbi:hypothetical protein RCG71_02245 [Kocuria sp. CPCC 205281]
MGKVLLGFGNGTHRYGGRVAAAPPGGAHCIDGTCRPVRAGAGGGGAMMTRGGEAARCPQTFPDRPTRPRREGRCPLLPRRAGPLVPALGYRGMYVAAAAVVALGLDYCAAVPGARARRGRA